MQRAGFNRLKLFIVLALICALAGTGFAHRIAGPSDDPSFAAYVQAGGSLADLCGDVEGSRHDTANGCEACRLISSAVLADHAPSVVDVLSEPYTLDVADHQIAAATSRLDLSRPVRGPPVA